MIAEYFATIDFKTTQEWENVSSAIHRFVQEVCIANNISTIYLWLQTKDSTKTLLAGALLPDLTMEILAINIA
jgi:hypothetical protein